MKPLLNSMWVFLVICVLASCAPQATAVPDAGPSLKPGDKIGEMIVKPAPDQSGEPSIYNYCSPYITESDPAVIVRD